MIIYVFEPSMRCTTCTVQKYKELTDDDIGDATRVLSSAHPLPHILLPRRTSPSSSSPEDDTSNASSSTWSRADK